MGLLKRIRRLAGNPHRFSGRTAVRHGLLAWLFIILTLPAIPARAASENQVKAAFLYNFAKFVEWPSPVEGSEARPFVIGVVGESPIADLLPALIRSELIKGRAVEVRHYRAGDELSQCQVVFVSRGQNGKDIQRSLAGRAILTVGETESFLAEGGMIQFVMVEQTVRFDVNVAAANQVGLKVSSRLLAVARKVAE
ncbi:MAG TPA: YfiR family protein [Methylomirabilota bacterium]|nr:YfiR family protein [Methylomirabilota bacterium]